MAKIPHFRILAQCLALGDFKTLEILKAGTVFEYLKKM